MKNINKDAGNDKRKYFRIDDMVCFSYRVISWSEVRSSQEADSSLPVHKITLKANLDRLSRELQPLYNIIKSSNSNVATYLASLDKKITILSEYLLEDDEIENDIEPQQVNIGGGGLMFVSEKPIVSGAMLELKMKLLPECMSISSYAKVISCVQMDESSEQKKYNISVEFESMDDDVRDLITRHVLIKERALINKQ